MKATRLRITSHASSAGHSGRFGAFGPFVLESFILDQAVSMGSALAK